MSLPGSAATVDAMPVFARGTACCYPAARKVEAGWKGKTVACMKTWRFGAAEA
jgi:hypothetical protein